ncbi:MAG: type III pantothenate kinase [Campylobacterota bacterium]|nr:type III pantothenate kinase [Campylobacterota bacterium]
MRPNEMTSALGVKHSILLGDIGNTHFHIYNGKSVEHLLYEEAIEKYQDKTLYYISVKHHLEDKIQNITTWKNISNAISLEGEYSTMGIDRKALCLSHKNGVFIDAGTAITVDVVTDGIYQGGYILAGLKTQLESYKNISSVLDVPLNKEISLKQLPRTTKDGISYGIIASIKALIEKHQKMHTLYFTGGDGEFLSSFFKESKYDDMLVFNGMRNALKDDK